MATIDHVTAPLVLRNPQGGEKVIAACFQHPQGVLYLDLFWHLSTPNEAAHWLKGELTGEGPWRIGSHRIRVLGCPQTDPHLQEPYAEWRTYLQNHGDEYPSRQQMMAVARRLMGRGEL